MQVNEKENQKDNQKDSNEGSQQSAVKSGVMPSMPGLAVFDLDGTLADTLSDLARCTNCALEECGFPTHPRESYRYFVGNGIDRQMQRALPPAEGTPEQIARLKTSFAAVYARQYLQETKPYTGITEMLALLTQAGVRLAVLSPKPQAFTEKLVTALFGDAFSVVLGAREGVPKKPDPAGVFEILSVMQMPADRTVYIGDTAVDVLTGRHAGVYTIGCAWGFRGEQELTEAGVDFVAQQPPDIVRHVLAFLEPSP